jgi:hypothetical protein
MGKDKTPKRKHVEACALGGCYAAKIDAGLFCARHWAMTSIETQKEYCDLFLSTAHGTSEGKKRADTIELRALGEIARYLEAHAPKKKGEA